MTVPNKDCVLCVIEKSPPGRLAVTRAFAVGAMYCAQNKDAPMCAAHEDDFLAVAEGLLPVDGKDN